MPESTSERLIRCFETAFPDLDRGEIPTLDADGVEQWDSIAHLTLLSLVGQEFSIDVDFEELEETTSFEAILDWVRERVADA